MAFKTLPRRKAIPTPRKVLINPGKGLNTLVSDNLIDDKEASDLQNIQFVEGGGVSKRFGFKQVGGDLSNNPRGLGTYLDASGSRYATTIDGTTLKYNAGSGWTAATGSTFTANQGVTFTQARSKLYVWNGTEGGTEFNGSACSRPGTMPKAKFAIFYKGYHFSSGVAGQINRLYISTSTDASDFTNAATTLNDSTEVPGATVFAGTGANFVDIDKDAGDRITGLATFQDSLVIFKENSIHQLTLDASGTPTVALVTRSLGAVSHKSIDVVENDVFFLSRRGYFVLGNEPNFFNAIRTNELSARIHDDVALIGQTNYELVSSIYVDNVYYSAVPISGNTANNVIFTYDRRFLAWSKSYINAESFTVYIDSSNVSHIYFTSSNSAKVMEMTQSFNDNGSAIDSYWVSKAFDLNNFDIYKRWLFVRLLFRQISGSVNISILTDEDEIAASATVASPNSSGEIGSLTLGLELLGGNPADQTFQSTNSTINVPYSINVKKTSRTLKVKVANSTVNQNFVLLGIVLVYYPYSTFKFPSTNKLF